MTFRLNRSLQFYYFFVLFTTMAGVGFIIQYFWLNGPFNTDNMAMIFEAGVELEEMKSRNRVQEMDRFVANDRVRDAFTLMGMLEKKSLRIQNVKSIRNFKKFERDLKVTKKALNGLLNYPELRSLILVLGSKMINFESFAVQNNWNTLSRMSKRINAKIHPSRVRMAGFFNLKKLRSLHRSLSRDLATMKKVTMNSVLSLDKKRQIAARIGTLNTEMNMMKKYLAGLKTFYLSSKNLQASYLAWFNEIAPIITLKKIEIEKNNKNLVWSFLGLLGFLNLALLLGYFVYRKNASGIRKEIEGISLEVVKDGLVSSEDQMEREWSSKFRKELTKYREYFHRRMSFGAIFQRAMPFSSLLLDSNLNLIWANGLFYEHFYLEEKGLSESLNWDFLQQFTNLGEDDPVLMALNQKISGVYQIQVRRNEEEEGAPYEMYVSSVEYSGQNRIMIFFYPLRNLEETIKDQTKSIVGPVSRTLDFLISGNFKQEANEKLARDFEIAGIGEIFSKFINYNDFIVQQKHSLLREIKNLEDSLYDQYQLMGDIRGLDPKFQEVLRKIVENFSHSKKAIVGNIDLRYELENQLKYSLNIVKQALKEKQGLLERSQKAEKIIEENIKAFENISSARHNFKALKAQIDDFRCRLRQSIDQTLLFVRRESHRDKRLEEGLGRIRLEMKGVEQVFSSFSEVVKNLDVGLSKIDLIVEQSEIPHFDDFQNKVKGLKKKLEEFTFQFDHTICSGEKSDKVVVKGLKSVYQGIQSFRYLGSEFSELVRINKEGDGLAQGQLVGNKMNSSNKKQIPMGGLHFGG